MLFNKGNRDISMGKDNEPTYFADYVEVLPPDSKKKESKIEKRFKKPLKELSKVQKELNSLSKEMKHRIREVRKNYDDELDYEKDMFKTRASVLDSKIKISDKKARIIKDMLNTELKDKKLQQDVSGISEGTNRPDMRGQYAEFFAGNSQGRRRRNDSRNLNGEFLSNPESYGGSKKRPRRQGQSQGRIEGSTEREIDQSDLKDKYGLDYEGAASNLKYKDKNLKEILHIDPKNDVYWLEIEDPEGNKIKDKVRRKHVEQLGEVTIDEDEDVARDEFNNTYEYEISDADNMPHEYRRQWEELGAFDEDEEEKEVNEKAERTKA